MATLSVDILLSILDYIDQKSVLTTLCLVNATFLNHAENHLYRTITVSPLSGTSVIRTLASSQRLALKVHTFEIGEYEWSYFTTGEKANLERTLKMMKTLRVLALHIRPPLRLGFMLEKCDFKLHTLSCGFLCDVHLARFFKNQVELKKVSLLSQHPPHHPCFIDTDCLPNLSTVSGDTTWINLLCPKRPIKHADVKNYGQVTVPTRALSLSSSPVERLDLFVDFERAIPPVISTTLPSLKHIVFPCVHPRLLGGSTMARTIAGWLSEFLGIFPNLETIEIQTGRYLLAQQDHIEDLQRFVMRAAGGAVPRLARFIVTFDLGAPASSAPVKIVWRREAQGEWNVMKSSG